MPRLKVLSGKDIIKIFDYFGLDKKTLRAIYRQASVYVSENELEKAFYYGV